MHNIIIDTNYSIYDAMKYYSYEFYFQTPVKESLNKLLNELDATKLYKGNQVTPTNCWKYEDCIEKFIRLLFKLPIYDYVTYNHYIDLLLQKHNYNLEFEIEFNKIKNSEINKPKPTKKKKVPNIYIRTETNNLFTGELEYDYTNFATGDSFISPNPDLLEELNAPKKKKKVKKAPKKDFGKIILNFKMK